MNKTFSKIHNYLYLFTSFFIVALLVIVLFYSFSYWVNNYNPNLNLEEKMFYVSIAIAIVTSITQWISGRIDAITETIQLIKREANNGKKNRS